MMSNSPWVGCSWAPSPALITEHCRFCESKWGLPGVWCRTIITSTPMASMFLAVSMKVSPLERLLLEAEKSSVSAPSRRAARAKLVFVRVEFSKNRLQQVLPAKATTLRPLRIEDPAENGRFVEDQRDFLGREFFQSQQVPPRPERRRLAQLFQNGRFCRHDNLPQEVNFAAIVH